MLKGHFSPSASYVHSKTQELTFLSQLFSLPLPSLEQMGTYESWHLAKLELKNAARVQFFKQSSPLLSSTNLSGEKKLKIGQFSLSYSYQRSGLKLTDRHPFARLYPLAEGQHGGKSWGILTRSGQTSTYLCLAALRLFLGEFKIHTQRGQVYYETKHLLKLHQKMGQSSKQAQLYFIDSSTEVGAGSKVPDQTTMAIIDTTCYVHGEEKLNQHLRFFSAQKIPVILLRSHLKLDCLGLEYASLGSLCLVLPAKSTTSEERKFKRLYKIFYEMCQIQGGFASLEHIYPFYHQERFHQLNNQRWLQVKKNNATLEKLMKKMKLDPLLKMHTFGHQFFFWLEFPHKVPPQEFQLLGRALSFLGVPYRFAESFGFDFVTLSLFPNEQKTSTLRVAPGDVDADCFPFLAKALLSWLEKQMKQGICP